MANILVIDDSALIITLIKNKKRHIPQNMFSVANTL